MGGRRDGGVRPQRELARHLAHQHRIDERLVALEVHHDLVGREAEEGDRFGQPVGSGGMVGGGGADLPAERGRGVRDLLVVGGDHDVVGPAFARALGGPRHQWLPPHVGEHLARQPR